MPFYPKLTFQHKSMMNVVIDDLLRPLMPSVTFLRLDGTVPANSRQDLVQKFNQDPSIDLMLLSTSVGKPFAPLKSHTTQQRYGTNKLINSIFKVFL